MYMIIQQMKKLLVFHPIIAPYRIDFFNSLHKTFDTRICLYQDNLITQKFDYAQIEKQFQFVPVPFKNKIRIGHRTFSLDFWRHLNEFHPDMVFTVEFNMSTFMVLLYKFLLRKDYKVVSICDDSYEMLLDKDISNSIHRISRFLLAPFIDDLILVEPRAVAWYQKNYKKGIYFPIIRKEDNLLSEINSLPSNMKAYMGEKYKCDLRFTYLFVGRLVDLKNIDALINAFSKLDQNECSLVIVGEGPLKARLMELANSLKLNVVFTGRLEGGELYQWYYVADCFILPSFKECFGAVTNEALIAGCWCVISNKAGSQCLIKDGVNGYTFDPHNETELVDKLRRSFSDVQKGHLNKVRSSRMLESFEFRFSKLIEKLNTIM